MRRATITLPDELEEALEAYRRDQEVPPALTAVAQVAIREYLAGRGYLERRADEGPSRSSEEKPWPRYPLYSGDPTLAERDEDALAGGPETPAFGEQ